MPRGSVNETAYYTDESNWIDNKTELEKGLKNFYTKTGVQPHLYITGSINGDNDPSPEEVAVFAENLYDELFTDEAHLLVVFFEFYSEEYITRYVGGTKTKTVIDQEAADILLDYLDRYYYAGNLTDSQYFSKAFDDAANRIMTKYRPPWISAVVAVAGIIIVILLFKWWKKSKDQKLKEAEMDERILNTPLDQFGDTSDAAENLSKKYEE